MKNNGSVRKNDISGYFLNSTPVSIEGATHKETSSAMHLIDPRVILAVGRIRREAEQKYGRYNHELIEPEDHINHAIIHAYGFLAKDTSEGSVEEHLTHAITRLILALSNHLDGLPKKDKENTGSA